jgi:hypothetical protein
MTGGERQEAPEKAGDAALAALLAGLLRDPGDQGVVLSGRCGTCGYLIASPNHEMTCGS